MSKTGPAPPGADGNTNSQIMDRSRRIGLVCLVLTGHLALAQNYNPTVAVCNGQQAVCATGPSAGLCASIVVNPDYQHLGIISHFELSWGDASPATVVPFSMNPPVQTHTFDLSGFYLSCQYQQQYFILLKTFHTDPAVEPTNSAFLFTVRNPPGGSFVATPQVPCTGDAIQFFGSAAAGQPGSYPNCPAAGNLFSHWDLGDGTYSSADTLTHTYASPGTYPVTYCTGNVCDTVCTSQTVWVLDAAHADLTVVAGATPVADSLVFRSCLYDTLVAVQLDAGPHHPDATYTWSVSDTSGWSWAGPSQEPDTAQVSLLLEAPGIYLVKVRVDNPCQRPDSAFVILQVVEEPDIHFAATPDTCQALLYTPVPVVDSTEYTVNGLPVAAFPVYLPLSSQPYVVTAQLDHFCGEYEAADTFFLKPIFDVFIDAPAADTVRCVGTDTLVLSATAGSTWLGGAPHLFQDSVSAGFLPTVPGTFSLVAELVVGACRNADTVVVTVEEPYLLSLDTPALGCGALSFTPQPYDPQVTYWIDQVAADSFPILLPASDSAYVLAASFGNSCGAWEVSAPAHVLLPEEVSITAPEGTVFCQGAPPVPLHASHSLGSWTGPHLTAEGADAWFDPVSAGGFEIVFTRGTDTCLRADTLQLWVVPPDSVDAGADRLVCQTAGALHLSGGFPAGGTFVGTAVQNDTVTLPELEPDSAYAFVYTLPAFPTGCNADSFTLTVALPPDATFESDRDTACQADTVRLFPAAAGAVEFLVDWGDGNTMDSLLFHTYAQPGTYPVILTVRTFHPTDGSLLCVVEDSTEVFIPTPLLPGQVAFDLDPSDGCAPLSVSMTNLSQPEHDHYRWDFGNGQVHEGYDPPSQWYPGTPATDTTYTIRLYVPNGCGQAETIRTVGVLPPPTAGIGLTDATPCSGTPVEVSILSIGSPAANTFFTSNGWVTPGNPSVPASFVFETGTLADTVSIWLVSTNDCGTDTALATVYVQPSDVTAQIGLPAGQPPCTRTVFTLTNQSTPGAPVLWKVSDGFSSTSDSIQLETALPGLFTVSLYAFGCGFDSSEVVLDFQPLPTVDLDHPVFACTGQPVSFGAIHDGSTLLLSFGDGTATDGSPATHTYPAPGIYQVSAESTAASGCRSTALGSIEILPTPQAQLTAPDTLCPGQAVAFTAASDQPLAACSWQFGDSGFAGGCQAWHTFLEPGPHPVLLSVTSPQGCTGQDSALLHTFPYTEAVIDPTILDPCTPMTVALQSPGTGTHSWQLGDGATATGATVVHRYPEAGTYVLQLVTNADGPCPDTATISLEARPAPEFGWEAFPPCRPGEGNSLQVTTSPESVVRLRGESYDQAGEYHWNLAPGPYVLEVANGQGCARDTQFVLPDIPPLEVRAEPDTVELLLGTAATLSATSNHGDTWFRWEPATYLDATDRADPLATPLRSITYLVFGTDTQGCRATDTVTVIVRADRRTGIFLPDAFSPNGDGINDVFYVRSSNPSVQALERCRIFDRYGEVVFETGSDATGRPAHVEDVRFGWDGTFRGRKAEAGTYRYVVVLRFIDGESASFTGNVQLLR